MALTAALAAAPKDTATPTTPIQVLTLAVAILAVVATLFSAFLLRRTGKGSVAAAKRSAEAAHISAEAASKSAKAAQDAVGVNAESAAGIAQRAVADALAKRYQDAAEQLGHEKAPVRLAGVYAMARLADDWPEERQTCVDVLCAYVRMPWPREDSDGGEAARSDAMVRKTVIEVIGKHLQGDESIPNWMDLRFDFTDALIRGAAFHQMTFRSCPDFRNARFEGETIFYGCHFLSGASFDGCRFEGRVLMDHIEVASQGGHRAVGQTPAMTFDHAHIGEGGSLILVPRFIAGGASIRGESVRVNGGLLIRRGVMPIPCGEIVFEALSLGSSAQLAVNRSIVGDGGLNDTRFAYPGIAFYQIHTNPGVRISLDGKEIEVDQEDWVVPLPERRG